MYCDVRKSEFKVLGKVMQTQEIYVKEFATSAIAITFKDEELNMIGNAVYCLEPSIDSITTMGFLDIGF